MRRALPLVAGALLGAVALSAALLFTQMRTEASLLATLTVAPGQEDAVAAVMATVTNSPTPTWTRSPTSTATATVTTTPTPTLTPSATLSTLVVVVTAINPDVTLDARPTRLPTTTATLVPTVAVPSPAATLAYRPTGDAAQSAQAIGWLRYAVDDPALVRAGRWEVFTSTYRSLDRRYLYTDADGARLTLRFLGAAVRVRYVRFQSYGIFEVRVDGQVVTTVDAYLPASSPSGDFVTTQVFALAHGWHTLEIRRLDRRNPDSTGGFVAIDGVDVYANGPEPTSVPTMPAVTPSFTPSPAPVQRIQVLVAPPTIPPTATPAPPVITTVTLTVAYDENGNKAAEPNEGVAGLPVQLITADTNRVVATGVTDPQGFVRLEATGTAPLRLVVPYFNRFWDIAPRTAGTRITLLLPPANRPALIP